MKENKVKIMKEYEIEIKLPIQNPEKVKKRLEELGFCQVQWIREKDIYFNSQYYDVKEKDEALRIRRSEDLITGKRMGQVNFKGPKIDRISMSRRELESGVDNPDAVEEILKTIGFEPVGEVVKERRYLRREEITACMDRVSGLGDYLELEVLAENAGNREVVLGTMEKILRELGYSLEDTITRSYLSMLMENDWKKDRGDGEENR